MFERFKRRLELRSRQRGEVAALRRTQRREVSRLRIYHQGFNARLAGRPCEPPGYPKARDYQPEDASYYAIRHQAWAEGWEAANEELAASAAFRVPR